MRRTNIYFPLPMWEKLKAMPKAADLSVSEILRRAIDAYLKKKV